MIRINNIKDDKLSELLYNYELALSQLSKPPYYIANIPEYSYYISRLLKSIDNNSNNFYSELTERIKFNLSFEEQLTNHGNNIDDIPNELNLKDILIQILNLIYSHNKKTKIVLDTIIEKTQRQADGSVVNGILSKLLHLDKVLIISNNYDEPSLNGFICKNTLKNIEVIRFKNFIKMNEEELKDYFIMGYILEGYRDFEVYHNLSIVINLFLYDFEEAIYKDCVNKYKSKVDTELQSDDRYLISCIKYEPPAPIPVSINQTLQNIIDRTNDWNDKEFDNNVDDPDESANEYISYHIEYEDNTDFDLLKSTDTVFDENNNLIKVNRLKMGDLIRVYKIDIGEILLNTAMEFQTEVFVEIGKHSQLWKNVLKELYQKIYKADIEHLHYHLRNHGIKVLPSTVLNNWIYGITKFPQSDKALKAIYELSKDISFGASVNFILKSKRIYNSTLISLGRDLKEEIKTFLIYGTTGEIIKKNKVSIETLRKTIDQQMPMKKIINITKSVIQAGDVDE